MSTSDDTQPAMTYPTVDQYERWKDRAGKLDMSVSEFMQSMVEAGIKVDKGFELELERDESRQELRAQRNDLRDELDHARNRMAELENQLYRGERGAITEFIEENPGASYAEIGQHIVDTAPERVNRHLEDLEGDVLRNDDGSYYLVEECGER